MPREISGGATERVTRRDQGAGEDAGGPREDSDFASSTGQRATTAAAIASPGIPAIVAPMKIWIDADAAPRDVKEIVFRAARRLQLETVQVANQWLSTPMNNPFVTSVKVQGGPDMADRHIAEKSERGDVVVTADIPLAAKLVEKTYLSRDDPYSSKSPG